MLEKWEVKKKRENGEGRSRGVTELEGSMRLKEVVHKE